MTSVPIKLSVERPVEVPSVSQQVDCPRLEHVQSVLDAESGTELVRDRSLVDHTLETGDMPRVYEEDVVTGLRSGDGRNVFRGPVVAGFLFVKTQRRDVVDDGSGDGQGGSD